MAFFFFERCVVLHVNILRVEGLCMIRSACTDLS